MKELVIASNNPHKMSEIREILSKTFSELKVLSLCDIGFKDEIIENGQTFLDNALIKVRAISKLGYAALGDDSGLCVDALGGAPGVRSARFAGEPCDHAKNNDALLCALSDIPYEKRTAAFITVIAYADPQGHSLHASGKCRGYILKEPIGANGFGYDPLFFYPPLNKTFAQLSENEKNLVSHRARAIAAFENKIKNTGWLV